MQHRRSRAREPSDDDRGLDRNFQNVGVLLDRVMRDELVDEDSDQSGSDDRSTNRIEPSLTIDRVDQNL